MVDSCSMVPSVGPARNEWCKLHTASVAVPCTGGRRGIHDPWELNTGLIALGHSERASPPSYIKQPVFMSLPDYACSFRAYAAVCHTL